MNRMTKQGETTMDNKKKKILESKGYTVGPVDKFLGLSKEESEYRVATKALRHQDNRIIYYTF